MLVGSGRRSRSSSSSSAAATCSRLPGTIALGFIHPIAIALRSSSPSGFAANAVAGERQRGTLEVVLARPMSRRRLYVTLLVATIAVRRPWRWRPGRSARIVGLAASGALADVQPERLPILWLNGVVLFAAFARVRGSRRRSRSIG